MLIPKFTLQNYTQIMGSPYDGNTSNWRSFDDVVRLLCVETFRERFALVDGRKLSTDLNVWSSETIMIWGKTINLRECVIAIKLVLPTLRTTNYFFRNIWFWTHLWIDIMLPKWTPIIAFQWWKVSRIKVRDGVTKNEGNCVVIQDDRGYFWWYEHLDRIDVRLWNTVGKWTQIGTCGSTWNSTQYHLHLQVDLPKTSPNPHRSSDLTTIQNKTIDPLRALRAAFSIIKDLPYEARYQDALGYLLEHAIIKWFQWSVFPDQTLQRYEMALIMHRVLSFFNKYNQLPIVNVWPMPYTDIASLGNESIVALTNLWKYWIMTWWPTGQFEPYKPLLYEQAMALLWRSFFNLHDLHPGVWYQLYVNYLRHHGYLEWNGWVLWKPLLRKDCFLLVWRTVSS